MIKNAILLVGVAAGSLVGFVLSLLFVNHAPFIFSEYSPVLVGGFLSYFIIREKPVLVGFTVSFIMIILSVTSLVFTVYAVAPSLTGSAFNFWSIILWSFYVPAGVIGALLANLFINKYVNRVV